MTSLKLSPDYSAVRNGGGGLIDFSSRGRILVSGSEAVMFLNGLITNDMKTLQLNSWMPAAFANVQGRLLAAARILHRADGFLIDTEKGTRAKVMELLDRFTLAGDFRVADLTDQTTMVSLQGRKAPDLITPVLSAAAAGTEAHQITVAALAAAEVTIIRATHSAEDGFDLFTDRESAAALRQALLDSGAEPVSDETADLLRIEAGIPSYGIDMDETTVVTETNLDDAVSFTKGCYLGQEIIIRIKHRGHVAKKVTGIVFSQRAEIETGAKIFSRDDQEIGRITSSTFSPTLARTIALGYVKYDYLAKGTEIHVKLNNAVMKAEVAELPLVRGSWQPSA